MYPEMITRQAKKHLFPIILTAGLIVPGQLSANIQQDLIWAVKNGPPSKVSRLLEKGANPDIPNNKSYTPLMIAAQNKDEALAQILLEAGANVNIRNKYGETAIMLASYNGLLKMVRQLYVRGAKINHDGWNPLIYAATNGHTQIIELLLNNGADIDATSDNGTTALMMAVRGNHLEAVSLLLEKGADISIVNEQGDNALSWAQKQHNNKIVEQLTLHAVHP